MASCWFGTSVVPAVKVNGWPVLLTSVARVRHEPGVETAVTPVVQVRTASVCVLVRSTHWVQVLGEIASERNSTYQLPPTWTGRLTADEDRTCLSKRLKMVRAWVLWSDVWTLTMVARVKFSMVTAKTAR